MDENNYTNEIIMNLFIIYGQCDKNISRTCRKFNATHPNLQPTHNTKFHNTNEVIVNLFV